ncbi:MAG: prepilin peptidase [Marinospirillum sp.]|uniref:prepilin peptidase n=1 Tax=Marinospirillum sp. TaxID=2183934 RepID=UPI001A0B2B79|nr:prepilin peptidase [Marinospirillum sp.]MBE0508258.1 prepilin peptidase [Marinospirillum sp.]
MDHWSAWMVGLPLYGLAWGSFLNAMGYRLGTRNGPYNRPLVLRKHQRSSCWSCDHTLAWYDNIPIVSWLALHGRCRYCGSFIPPVYFIGELTFASLPVIIFMLTESLQITLAFVLMSSWIWLRMLEAFWRSLLHQVWILQIKERVKNFQPTKESN